MSAPIVSYYEADLETPMTCPSCRASCVPRQNVEYYRELFDVTCPNCDQMLLIVPYPTHEETRAAAAAGRPDALAALGEVERREARWRRADELKLKDPEQLPALEDVDAVRAIWDFDQDDDDESWTILRCGDVVLWRELAFWEGYERYEEVFKVVRRRYGSRLVEFQPSEASRGYLYGDRWTIGVVERLQNQLGKPPT